MITAVDTNILLDILIPDARYADASQQRLDDALAQGALIINEVIYAEMSSQFPTPEELDRFLIATKIRLEQSQPKSLQQAAKAWRLYLKGRGDWLQCPQCGTKQQVTCSHCEETIRVRQHILSDFLVGGHALVQADRLLTRDLGYYRKYFPDLKLFTVEHE
jgi:predicted nucleic acid-binding protein